MANNSKIEIFEILPKTLPVFWNLLIVFAHCLKIGNPLNSDLKMCKMQLLDEIF